MLGRGDIGMLHRVAQADSQGGQSKPDRLLVSTVPFFPFR